MRHELVDDQMLAVRLKAAGTPLLLASSGGRVRVRMYVGARETLRGWRKNTSAGLGEGSLAAASVLAAAGIVSAVAPTVAVPRGPRWAGLAGVALQLAARGASDAVSPTPGVTGSSSRPASSSSRCSRWSAPPTGSVAASCGGAAATRAPITGSPASDETCESRRGEGCVGRRWIWVRWGQASQSPRPRLSRPPPGPRRRSRPRRPPSLPAPPP